MADTFTVTREKAGVEDIYFGTGTYSRLLNDGATLTTIRKVNSDHLPVVDKEGLFSSTYLTDVLKELYDLITESHVQSWWYQDSNGTVIHGMGDVANEPGDIEPNESWYKVDSVYGTVLHGMGDVIDI